MRRLSQPGIVELQRQAIAVLHVAFDCRAACRRCASSRRLRRSTRGCRDQSTPQDAGQRDRHRRCATRRTRAGVGDAPGSSCASRTLAPTIATRPKTSTSPSGIRIAPSVVCMPSTRVESAGTGTESSPLPRVAVDLDPHLPGAGRHQPERAGEELRIVLRGAGRDRARARTVAPRVRRSGTMWMLVDARRRAADFDFGDARNHLRRADGDQQPVGAGAAFVRRRPDCPRAQTAAQPPRTESSARIFIALSSDALHPVARRRSPSRVRQDAR